MPKFSTTDRSCRSPFNHGLLGDGVSLAGTGPAAGGMPWPTHRKDRAWEREWFGASEPEQRVHRGQQPDGDKGPPAVDRGHHEAGALPPALDPERPTPEELDAIEQRIVAYQETFQRLTERRHAEPLARFGQEIAF